MSLNFRSSYTDGLPKWHSDRYVTYSDTPYWQIRLLAPQRNLHGLFSDAGIAGIHQFPSLAISRRRMTPISMPTLLLFEEARGYNLYQNARINLPNLKNTRTSLGEWRWPQPQLHYAMSANSHPMLRDNKYQRADQELQNPTFLWVYNQTCVSKRPNIQTSSPKTGIPPKHIMYTYIMQCSGRIRIPLFKQDVEKYIALQSPKSTQ